VQVAVKHTWLFLINSHEVPSAFGLSFAADASPAEIFHAINLRSFSTRVRSSIGENSLIAHLQLIELRAQSSSQSLGRKRVQSHLEFSRLEIGFASAAKSWAAQAMAGANSAADKRNQPQFARESLRYSPGRIVFEQCTGDLGVDSLKHPKIANAEQVQLAEYLITLSDNTVDYYRSNS
jgi:hypothetical protein